MSTDNVISTTLEMLKKRREELQKSLGLIEKAIDVFEPQSQDGTQRKRNRKPMKPISKKPSTVKTGKRARRGIYRSGILNALKQKNGQTSGEIIQSFFGKQTREKDKQRFAQNIYNTINKLKKKGTLKSQNSKIYLS